MRDELTTPVAIRSITATHGGGDTVITAIVLYDLPPNIGKEDCRAHFHSIAPGFLDVPGLVRKQFIHG